jgi:hypothetical protein
MPADFLAKLMLSDDERAKLAGIGAKSALMLLLAQRASPSAFEKLLGAERAKTVLAGLAALLTPDEKSRLEGGLPEKFALGARIDIPPSKLPEPRYDVEERDRLFGELKALRARSSQSPQDKVRILELERKLNALLE